jgi:hypothetical protein
VTCGTAFSSTLTEDEIVHAPQASGVWATRCTRAIVWGRGRGTLVFPQGFLHLIYPEEACCYRIEPSASQSRKATVIG